MSGEPFEAWSVDWSVVVPSGLLGPRVIASLTFVADVGKETRVAFDHVVDLLKAAVRKAVVVEASGEIPVTALPVAVVVPVVVLHRVVELILGLRGTVGPVGTPRKVFKGGVGASEEVFMGVL